MKNHLTLILLCSALFIGTSCQKQKTPKPNLNRGLFAHYPFTGNADDATGNGFDGEAKNGAKLAMDKDGKKDNAYYFDGVDDYIKTPLKDMSYSNKTSLFVLIQPDEITKNRYYNICRQGPHPANFLLSFQEYGKILSFGMFTGGSYQELDVSIDPSDYTDGNWHCVAGIYDGNEMRLYVDGQLLGSTPKSGLIEEPGGAYNPIGSMIGRERFKGRIDELRYYHRNLTKREIDMLCGNKNVPH